MLPSISTSSTESLPVLTVTELCKEAARFAEAETRHGEPSLYGITDGKAIGTYLESKFKVFLAENYSFAPGNAASGIDLPSIGVDIKVTSVAQPQSSCPFQSARQKIWGLGYSLLIFVYAKRDEPVVRTATLDIQQVIFVDKAQTGDFQTTRGLQDILDRDGNTDDIIAFLQERFLAVDDIEAQRIADEIIGGQRPETGYLTISNALQWRLQYKRVITQAGNIPGLHRLR